jgi:hypothetical protein
MRKPTLQHIQAAAFIVFFCAVLVLPGLLVGKDNSWSTQDEGRNPAEFPSLRTEEGALNPNLKEGFETWFNDHLGLRSDYIKLKANVYVGLLGESTSEKVYLGKDGWYFYTANDDIKLVTGEYPLGEAELRAIATNQQAVHDWYQSQGIDYVLMLTPSKTTVYPEYLYGNYEVERSPIDVVTDYLEEHTDVTVVNTKPAVLAAKKEGKQVYWKDDTHWNSNGSYVAYEALIEAMNREGILADEPPVPSFLQSRSYPGNLKRMLGDQYLLGSQAETIDELSIEQTSASLPNDDALLKEATNIIDGRLGNLEVLAVYDNPTKDNTLLLYSDSFCRPAFKFPVFMAEHYGRFMYAGLQPRIVLELDEFIAPDVVIMSYTECYLATRLVDPPNIPLMVDNPSFLDLPIKQMVPSEDLYLGGLVFDRLDNKRLTDGIPPINNEGISYHIIDGWALDANTGLPLKALYLKIGDAYLQCNYGRSRADVAEHFNNDALKNVGYRAIIPSELLKDGDGISFIAIGTDGTYRLPEYVFAPAQSTATQEESH